MSTPERVNGVRPEAVTVEAGRSPANGAQAETYHTMVFRPPHSVDVEIKSPEELARSGFEVSSNAIEQTWGTDAVDRYNQEKAVQKASQKLGDRVRADSEVSKMNA